MKIQPDEPLGRRARLTRWAWQNFSPSTQGVLPLTRDRQATDLLPPGRRHHVRPQPAKLNVTTGHTGQSLTHDGEEGGIVAWPARGHGRRRTPHPRPRRCLLFRKPQAAVPFRCVGGKPCEVISGLHAAVLTARRRRGHVATIPRRRTRVKSHGLIPADPLSARSWWSMRSLRPANVLTPIVDRQEDWSTWLAPRLP